MKRNTKGILKILKEKKTSSEQSQDKLEPIASPMSDWNWKKWTLRFLIGFCINEKKIIKNGTLIKKGIKMKEYFEKKFGQGTAFDLDYGKLLIIALLIYIAFFK